MTQFTYKTLVLVMIASAVLFTGIWYNTLAEARHLQAIQDRAAVINAENDLQELHHSVEQYERAVNTLNWEAGTQVEREPVALSTRMERDELHLLQSVLRATYESRDGLFSVSRFTLEHRPGPAFQIDMAGENVLVFRDQLGDGR